MLLSKCDIVKDLLRTGNIFFGFSIKETYDHRTVSLKLGDMIPSVIKTQLECFTRTIEQCYLSWPRDLGEEGL